jgi:hypothetical protein
MAKAKLPIPEMALRNNGLILGKPGAGKSALARLLFEHAMDSGHRAIFSDPMGDAAGIRLTPDGKRSRFRSVVIIGGPHADIPITAEDGAKVGKFVAQSRWSFLLDLSDMLQAEQVRFMGHFADALYEHMAVPALLLVDEAHLFAPQERGEASSFVINRMVRLNSQGRKRGIFLWLMTQRPARISKNIIAGTESLVAMKMTTPRDIGAMEDWLSAHDPDQAREAKTVVPKLKAGEAIVWIPGAEFFQQVQFPFHSTFDSGRTPEHGETIGKIEIPKVSDLAEIAAAFGVTAAGDARDEEIAALRAEARELREQRDSERREHRATRDQLASLRTSEERAIGILLDIQLRVGAAIGSQRIEPLPITAPYEQFLMVEAADGVIRPMPRTGANKALVPPARRRMADARLPSPEKGSK